MIARYSIPEIERIFLNKYSRWLEVEIEVLRYYLSKGKLSLEEFEVFENSATFTVDDIVEEEKITKHDFVAFLNVISRKSEGCQEWLHFGLTTTDVVDTALSLMLKECNQIITEEIRELLSSTKKMALKYQKLPCLTRTHGMFAEISSFGFKFVTFFDDLQSSLKNFLFQKAEVEVCMLSGSVGNYAHVEIEMQDFVANSLKLKSVNSSTQILSRERYMSYLQSISRMGKTIEKLAIVLRTLARQEIAEVAERVGQGQIGSSSMPHKRNPITLENICGLSRLLSSYAHCSENNVILWDERDISHSSNERIILEDAITLLINMVRKMNVLLSGGLCVFEDKILEAVATAPESVYSQGVMNFLLPRMKGKDRSEVLTSVKKLVEKGELKDKAHLLSKGVSPEEIGQLFKPENYLTKINQVCERIFEHDFWNHWEKILVSEDELDSIISRLACEINSYYAGEKEEIVVVPVMEGSVSFVGSLLTKLRFNLRVHSVKVSFYEETNVIGRAKGKVDFSIFANKKVLILEDLLDGGSTLRYLRSGMEAAKTLEVKVSSLLVKDKERIGGELKDLVDWVGRYIPDVWIAGFGLDSKSKYRNAPFIGVLLPEYR